MNSVGNPVSPSKKKGPQCLDLGVVLSSSSFIPQGIKDREISEE
jgi:hypothetical protein